MSSKSPKKKGSGFRKQKQDPQWNLIMKYILVDFIWFKGGKITNMTWCWNVYSRFEFMCTQLNSMFQIQTSSPDAFFCYLWLHLWRSQISTKFNLRTKGFFSHLRFQGCCETSTTSVLGRIYTHLSCRFEEKSRWKSSEKSWKASENGKLKINPTIQKWKNTWKVGKR